MNLHTHTSPHPLSHQPANQPPTHPTTQPRNHRPMRLPPSCSRQFQVRRRSNSSRTGADDEREVHKPDPDVSLWDEEEHWRCYASKQWVVFSTVIILTGMVPVGQGLRLRMSWFAQASGLMFRDNAWVLLEVRNEAARLQAFMLASRVGGSGYELVRVLTPQCEKRLCSFAARFRGHCKAQFDGCVALAEIHTIHILPDTDSASTERCHSANTKHAGLTVTNELDVSMMSAYWCNTSCLTCGFWQVPEPGSLDVTTNRICQVSMRPRPLRMGSTSSAGPRAAEGASHDDGGGWQTRHRRRRRRSSM